jgi:CheY-like chemotaxis protein
LPTKILVVDDSATMRKILEMTFAGEDAEVVTVADGQSAIGKAAQIAPDVVFADVSMPGMDAYAVSHAVKNDPALAKTAVIALASQHHPYDEAKGQSSGVDAHVLKPFDTQALIDLTAQVLRAPRAVAEGAPPAAQPAAAPPMPRAAAQTTNVAPPPPPGGGARPAPAATDARRQIRQTAAFGEAPPLRPPAAKPVLELAEEPDIEVDAPEPTARPAASAMPRATAPSSAMPAAKPVAPQAAKPSFPAAGSPAPAAAKPAPAAAAPQQPAAPKPAAAQAPAPSAAVAAATSGLEQKLAGLDLSKDQLSAVLALSREVIEQVVWEVVPELAETLIKEEIARLTR